MSSTFSNPEWIVGFQPISPTNGTQNLTLSAAATWAAYGFVPRLSKTINEISIYCNLVTGSLGSSDLSCSIYSDTNGVPNASLSSGTTLASAISTNAWARFTGLSQAVTGGTQYWAVIKNLNGSPASNNARFLAGAGSTLPTFTGGGTANRGYALRETTNSGTAWTAIATAAAAFMRIGYSDGSYEGLPISAIGSGTSATGSSESGVKATSPANAILNVKGIAAFVKVGTVPGGNVRARLYTGTTLQATSNTIGPGVFNAASSLWLTFEFASAYALAAGTSFRMTISDDTSEANGYIPQDYTIDSDSNSLALLPFGGTMQKTVYNGSSWTDTNTIISPFALILDPAGPFAAGGGGGGLIVPRGMNGGYGS